jgi:hypothetical protein
MTDNAAYWDKWIRERELRELGRRFDSAFARFKAEHPNWFDSFYGLKAELLARVPGVDASTREVGDAIRAAWKRCHAPGWSYEETPEGKTIIGRPGKQA